MKKRFYVYVIVFNVLLMVLINFALQHPYQRELMSVQYWRNVMNLGEVMRLVRQGFVDEEKASYPNLTRSALREIIGDLDEYSEYMFADDYEEFSMQSDQQYVGIGVEIFQSDARVTVGSIFEGSPAGEVGMQAGDQIVKVNGENTENYTLSQMVDVLRGEEGSSVDVEVYRPESAEQIAMTVERRHIDFPTIRDIEISDDAWKIGYLRLVQFGKHSAEEFEEALTELEGQGMRGLIFDLRNNPGGLLPAAVDVASQFVEADELIVSTKGRSADDIRSEYSFTPARKEAYPVVVLINSHSASASEIVSGALQDHGKAVVVGTTSVGKGSVQSIYDLGNGDGLRMTTAMYYLPSGRTIHKTGVVPDVEVDISNAEQRKLFIQRNHSNLIKAGQFSAEYGFEPIEDPQLQTAREILRGVIAFNG